MTKSLTMAATPVEIVLSAVMVTRSGAAPGTTAAPAGTGPAAVGAASGTAAGASGTTGASGAAGVSGIAAGTSGSWLVGMASSGSVKVPGWMVDVWDAIAGACATTTTGARASPATHMVPRTRAI